VISERNVRDRVDPLVGRVVVPAAELASSPPVSLWFAAAVVAVAFAAAMWRSQRGPGTAALTTLALGAAWWSLLYGLELSSATLAGTLLFARLSYLGIVVVPVSWFVFALAYTGHRRRLHPSTVGALSFPAVLAAALPWTSGSSDLFWASTSLVSGGPGTVLAVEYGPAFWLWSVYSYALVAAGTVLVLRSVPSGARLFRAQRVLLVVGVAAPWLANLAYLLRVGPVVLDITPLGFVVSALVLGAGLRRYRLLDVHPAARVVARDELVDRMSESVIVLNGEGRIVDVNRSARAVLGVGTDDVVGVPLGTVAPDLAAVVEGTDAEDGEFTTDDPSWHFEARVSPLRGHGGAVGRLVVLRDVTGRRRHERHIAVLNRVLRHDLNNDIAVVQGYSELLAEDPGNEAYVEVIAERAAEMADLLETVRTVELGLESGFPPLSPVDIVRVVEERVEVARRAHPGATFETGLPTSERVCAVELVHSAVDNLVENAVEHSDRDTPHVSVSVDRVVECGRPYVTVRVADDGPGIPEPDRRVLVGDEGAGLEDASGLGLWLVNWIVSESGGDVVCEPNEPRGTVVVLRLPPADPGDATGHDRDCTAGLGPPADGSTAGPLGGIPAPRYRSPRSSSYRSSSGSVDHHRARSMPSPTGRDSPESYPAVNSANGRGTGLRPVPSSA
jgi:PAS domain S-box-containing protein